MTSIEKLLSNSGLGSSTVIAPAIGGGVVKGFIYFL